MKDALGHAREAGVVEEGRLTVELPLPSFLGSVYASKISYYASMMACHIGHLLELLSLEEDLVYPESWSTLAGETLIRRGIRLPISARNPFAEQRALIAAKFNATLKEQAFEQALDLGAAAVGAPIPGAVLRLCARRIVKRYWPYWFRKRAGASGSETTVPPSAEPAESASGGGVAQE